MKDSYARRVGRGAALLDKERPEWYKQIDPEALNLKSEAACILGQAFNNNFAGRAGYQVGLKELGLSEEEAPRYGFDAGTFKRYRPSQMDRSYRALGQEWRRRIGYRLIKEGMSLSA